MSFFRDFFHTEGKRAESVVLIDIGARSVAGAYARLVEGELPAILYTRRMPIEAHADEPPAQAMFRALTVLGNALIREGAPALARVAGSGRADAIFVSVNAPWEETAVRTEHFDDVPPPFTFTKSLVEKKLAATRPPASEKTLVNESIIGTILNGYETRNPYGQEAHRATMIVLSSLIDRSVMEGILSTLRGLYHAEHILPIAGNALRYQALRIVFPHEPHALIIDAIGSLTAIALVRGGILVATMDIPNGSGEGDAWGSEMVAALKELSARYPLPRTIFLIADDEELAALRAELETPQMSDLWLSDNPPTIVPILGGQLSGFVRSATAEHPDLPLFLMALSYGKGEIG